MADAIVRVLFASPWLIGMAAVLVAAVLVWKVR